MLDFFNTNIRFQIVCVMIAIIVLFDFFRQKRLPAKKNRYFTAMAVFTIINLIFDVATVYTVSFIDSVPAELNLGLHRVYYVTISLVVETFFLCVYSTDSDKVASYSIIRTISFIAFILGVFSGVFLPVEFITTESYSYSTGQAVLIMYFSVAIQLCCIFFTIVVNKIAASEKGMLFIGLVLWIAASVIQYFVPTLFLTGLGITILLLFIYLSFENPAVYVDTRRQCLNKAAFDVVLKEKMLSSSTFYITNVVFEDLSVITNQFGYSAGDELIINAREYILEKFGKDAFLFSENSLVFFCDDEESVKRAEEELKSRLNEAWEIHGARHTMRVHADILCFPDFAHNLVEVNNTLHYAQGNHKAAIDRDSVFYIDEECVSQINKFYNIKNKLRDAVENDNFTFDYVPIHNTESGKVVALTSLVRLRESLAFDSISMTEFMQIAEQSELVVDLTYYLFDKLCEIIKKNKLDSSSLCCVEFNVSTVEAISIEFVQKIEEIIKKHDIPAKLICLKMIDINMPSIESSQRLICNLDKLRKIGVQISTTNISAIFENTNCVKDNTYSTFRLDENMVNEYINGDMIEVLEGIIALLKTSNISVVAQGIEKKDQAELLKGIGVEYMQGSYYSDIAKEEELIKYCV